MARRYFKRTIRKRRTFRKKRFYKKTTNHKSMVRLGAGFPDKMVTKLKYADLINFSVAAGSTNTYVFSANGIYDPNYTGGGHQPRFYDQLTALYNHWIVIGSKIKVTLTPRDTTVATGATQCISGIYLNDDTTITPSSAVALSETGTGLRGSSVKFLAPGATHPYILTKTFSSRKIFGKHDIHNGPLRGSTASNPTEGAWFTTWIFNNDASVTASWTMFVEIEYIAVFSEPKDIDSS